MLRNFSLFCFTVLFAFYLTINYGYSAPEVGYSAVPSALNVDENITGNGKNEVIYNKNSDAKDIDKIDIDKIVDGKIGDDIEKNKDNLPKSKKVKKKKTKEQIESEKIENAALKGTGTSILNEKGNTVKDTARTSKKGKTDKIVNEKVYNKTAKKYGDLYIELASPKFVENKNGNRDIFVVYNPISVNEDIRKFAKEYFYMFKFVNYLKVRTNSDYNLDEILEFTKKVVLDSNLVIMNKFYDRINNQYYYNIVFLSGDITNRNLPFNRTYKETPPNKINLFDKVSVAKDILDDTEESYLIERKQLLLKTSEVVGYWKDFHTNIVYDIREISKDKTLLAETIYKNNQKVYDSNNEELDEFTPRYYAGYLIYSKKYINPKGNNVDWYKGDLVLEFEKVSGTGYVLYNNKSLIKAEIKVYPEKGYIQIKLPNGANKYLIPAEEMSEKAFFKMYKLKIPIHVYPTEETYVDYIDRAGFFSIYNFTFAKYIWAIPLIVLSVFLAFTVIM